MLNELIRSFRITSLYHFLFAVAHGGGGAHLVYIKIRPHITIALIVLNMIVESVFCADNARDLGKKEAAIASGYMACGFVNNDE